MAFGKGSLERAVSRREVQNVTQHSSFFVVSFSGRPKARAQFFLPLALLIPFVCVGRSFEVKSLCLFVRTRRRGGKKGKVNVRGEAWGASEGQKGQEGLASPTLSIDEKPTPNVRAQDSMPANEEKTK